MNDPFLSAWTTQYTNTPIPSLPQISKAMSSTFEKTRPRRKARRSCLNCQRGHRTCDNHRPCEQCTKRGKQQTCIDGTHKQFKYLRDSEYHPARRRGSRDCSGGITGLATGCIDPGLLHAHAHAHAMQKADRDIPPAPRSTSSVEDEGVETPPPCAIGENHELGMRNPEEEEDIFGDILEELLVFDGEPVKRFTLGCEDAEMKSQSHGFSISTGWSSTFFPPDVEEQERYSGRAAASRSR
ncbi:hypothetical protein BJX64DRAFT_266754 [Aspergillus heterothallicus]